LNAFFFFLTPGKLLPCSGDSDSKRMNPEVARSSLIQVDKTELTNLRIISHTLTLRQGKAKYRTLGVVNQTT
jgi:hypothetical protein